MYPPAAPLERDLLNVTQGEGLHVPRNCVMGQQNGVVLTHHESLIGITFPCGLQVPLWMQRSAPEPLSPVVWVGIVCQWGMFGGGGGGGGEGGGV